MNETNNNAEKSDLAKREEEVLAFWEENNIFEKSVEKPAGGEPEDEFVFYDGPPFATGMPHYGHVLPGTMKDVVPRFQTMRGNRVRRRWGWDCHGLPLENKVEGHLNLETKKDIEEYGIAKFNEEAKEYVLRYADDWKEIIPRTGRWVDMENDYRTMDTSYSESIWWAFENLHKKGLIYEGYKSMHICPRCETSLSNFEVNQGYEDIKDFSVTVKFELENEDNTYLLAWTTTPWTLPGNAAVAVNPDLEYVKVTVTQGEYQGESYILGKERVEDTFAHSALTKGEGVEKESWRDAVEVEDVDISYFLGASYVPPFSYYRDADIEHKENAWKVYEGEFVTEEDGTGIVHIAPAFGEEDMGLARDHDIPVIHHVGMDGRFSDDVTDFAGEKVKPKGDHLRTDIEIIKHLAHENLLVAKEKITHSYPHCWRCDTPLLNYATNSWFVEVTQLKDTLVEENKEVNWVPEEIGSNRFGNWLEGARDWAISRTRYWGAPLPVWRSEDGKNMEVIGSLEELEEKTLSSNNYYVMRHGEAEHNAKNEINSADSDKYGLTDGGKEDVRERAKEMADEDIGAIFVSPFRRCRETAEIMAEVLGIEEGKIIEDERIEEYDFGAFDGEHIDEYHAWREDRDNWYSTPVPDGESFIDLKKRAGDFLYDIDAQYSEENILIISHGWFQEVVPAVIEGAEQERAQELRKEYAFAPGHIELFEFARMPHNADYERDLHRPYIDEVTWENDGGQTMRRVEEVFDCWFESGSMPYASNHYPFETNVFDAKEHKEFPADFIAEGLDQTRGWFYSLLVLSVALFDEAPYKNVVVNGMVLAEDGKKMSKRLGNYPELGYMIDRYGVDSLRYYLIDSPAVRAEPMRFSEDGVDEVVKKLIYRFKNVYSFYEMYTSEQARKKQITNTKSQHILDRWITSRLNEVRDEVTDNLQNYRLDKAARPLMDFVDDLSTWYVRRSRDRFRDGGGEDKDQAVTTTRFVLREFSKLLAPFMPFVAEDMYQKIIGREELGDGSDGEAESVHLTRWPEEGEVDEELIGQMKDVRRIVSDALDLRAQAQIKVRQPLSTLRVQKTNDKSQISKSEELVQLIRDEVNVKEVAFDAGIEDEIELDTEITPELKKEGQARELIRNIQKLRKKAGLDPDDEVTLSVATDKAGKDLIAAFQDEIVSTTGLSDIEYTDNDGAAVGLDDISLTIEIV